MKRTRYLSSAGVLKTGSALWLTRFRQKRVRWKAGFQTQGRLRILVSFPLRNPAAALRHFEREVDTADATRTLPLVIRGVA